MTVEKPLGWKGLVDTAKNLLCPREKNVHQEKPHREKESETLLNADYVQFLADCDCAPNGEEWLDRKEIDREGEGVWYFG